MKIIYKAFFPGSETFSQFCTRNNLILRITEVCRLPLTEKLSLDTPLTAKLSIGPHQISVRYVLNYQFSDGTEVPLVTSFNQRPLEVGNSANFSSACAELVHKTVGQTFIARRQQGLEVDDRFVYFPQSFVSEDYELLLPTLSKDDNHAMYGRR